MPPPQGITCEICGKKFFKNSYAIHLKQCAKKREDSTSQCEYCGYSVSHDEYDSHVSECKKAHKGKKAKTLGQKSAITESVRKKIEKADRGESIVPEDDGLLAGEFDPFRRLDELVQSEDVVKEDPEDGRQECGICHRKFNSDRIAKHQLICQKIKEREASKRRKPLTSEDWRVKGTDFESYKNNRTDVKEIKRQAKEKMNELKGSERPGIATTSSSTSSADVSALISGKEASTFTPCLDATSSQTNQSSTTTSKIVSTPETSSKSTAVQNVKTDDGSTAVTPGTSSPVREASSACVSNPEEHEVTAVRNVETNSSNASTSGAYETEGNSACALNSAQNSTNQEINFTQTAFHSPQKQPNDNSQLNTSMASTASTGKSKLRVGDLVLTAKGHEGVLKFKGRVWGLWKGSWYGIELNEPYGKNDGSVQDVKYFDCAPNHGVFVRPHTITPVRKWDDDVEEIKKQEKEEKERLYQEQLRIREKLAAKKVQKSGNTQGKQNSSKNPSQNSSANPINEANKSKQQGVPKLKTDFKTVDDPPAGSAVKAVRKLSARQSERPNSHNETNKVSSRSTNSGRNDNARKFTRPGPKAPAIKNTSSEATTRTNTMQKHSQRSLVSSNKQQQQPSRQALPSTKTSVSTASKPKTGRSHSKPTPLTESAGNAKVQTSSSSTSAAKPGNDAASLRQKRADFFEKKFKQEST